jgi:3-methyladenine DNA glycosylase AlkD
MESLRNEEQRRVLMGFFKTGPGEYGEGDEFLGLKVPQTREIVKAALTESKEPLTMSHEPLTIDEVPELLMSKWHEVRLCGLLILVAKFEKLSLLPTSPSRERSKKLRLNDAEAIKKRNEILTMYLQYAERANNWDLVDLSAPKILGAWIKTPSCPPAKGEDWKRRVIDELAQSDNLWKQRMSIVCTWKTSQMGDPSWCLRYAEIHLHHPHDLMHKAVGWMLREMGKRCSMDLLRDFLRQHAHEMPRTMLRYAIEKMSEKERKEWMAVEV